MFYTAVLRSLWMLSPSIEMRCRNSQHYIGACSTLSWCWLCRASLYSKGERAFFLDDARLMSARDRVQKLQQRDPGACFI